MYIKTTERFPRPFADLIIKLKDGRYATGWMSSDNYFNLFSRQDSEAVVHVSPADVEAWAPLNLSDQETDPPPEDVRYSVVISGKEKGLMTAEQVKHLLDQGTPMTVGPMGTKPRFLVVSSLGQSLYAYQISAWTKVEARNIFLNCDDMLPQEHQHYILVEVDDNQYPDGITFLGSVDEKKILSIIQGTD